MTDDEFIERMLNEMEFGKQYLPDHLRKNSIR
jgi:hypothetical protein